MEVLCFFDRTAVYLGEQVKARNIDTVCKLCWNCFVFVENLIQTKYVCMWIKFQIRNKLYETPASKRCTNFRLRIMMHTQKKYAKFYGLQKKSC